MKAFTGIIVVHEYPAKRTIRREVEYGIAINKEMRLPVKEALTILEAELHQQVRGIIRQLRSELE